MTSLRTERRELGKDLLVWFFIAAPPFPFAFGLNAHYAR